MREPAEHAHEDFLRDLFGIVRSDDAMGHAEHAALELVIEHLHRARFASAARGDQLGIVGERRGHARAWFS